MSYKANYNLFMDFIILDINTCLNMDEISLSPKINSAAEWNTILYNKKQNLFDKYVIQNFSHMVLSQTLSFILNH